MQNHKLIIMSNYVEDEDSFEKDFSDILSILYLHFNEDEVSFQIPFQNLEWMFQVKIFLRETFLKIISMKMLIKI